MELKVCKKSLEKILEKMSKIIDNKSQYFLLHMVKFNIIDAQTLELTATNYEHGLIAQIPIMTNDIETPLSFCINYKNFYKIIQNLKEEEIILKITNNSVIIKNFQETYIFELLIISSDNFPNIPINYFQNIDYYIINAGSFKKLIKNVSFVILQNKDNFNYNGIYLEVLDKNLLRAVTTDGRRLALIDEYIENNEEFEYIKKLFNQGSFLIDKRNIDIMLQIADEEEFIKIGKYQNYIILKFSNGLYFAQLLEADFINYKDIISLDFSNTLKIDLTILEDAINKAKILSTKNDINKTSPIKLNLISFSTLSKIEINSIETDLGKASIQCPAEYNGEKLEVILNADYLLSVLKILKNNKVQKVRIDIDGEKTPVKITGENFPEFCYFVMPMII